MVYSNKNISKQGLYAPNIQVIQSMCFLQPVSSSGITKQPETGDAINYSLSIAGYKPEEVGVTLHMYSITIKKPVVFFLF